MSRVHSLAFTVTEETFPGTNQHELQSGGTAAATTALRHMNCPAHSECTAISGAYQTQHPVSIWQRTISAAASHCFKTHLLFTQANSGRESSSLLLPHVIEDKTAHQPHKPLRDVQLLGLEGTLGPLKKAFCIREMEKQLGS